MPAAHQRSAMRPSRQRLTLAEWVRQMEIMLSMAVVERSVRASVGGTPRRSTVRVSGLPLAQAGRGTRVGLVQLAGQRAQLGFGVEGGVGVVGRAHLHPDRAA